MLDFSLTTGFPASGKPAAAAQLASAPGLPFSEQLLSLWQQSQPGAIPSPEQVVAGWAEAGPAATLEVAPGSEALADISAPIAPVAPTQLGLASSVDGASKLTATLPWAKTVANPEAVAAQAPPAQNPALKSAPQTPPLIPLRVAIETAVKPSQALLPVAAETAVKLAPTRLPVAVETALEPSQTRLPVEVQPVNCQVQPSETILEPMASIELESSQPAPLALPKVVPVEDEAPALVTVETDLARATQLPVATPACQETTRDELGTDQPEADEAGLPEETESAHSLQPEESGPELLLDQTSPEPERDQDDQDLSPAVALALSNPLPTPTQAKLAAGGAETPPQPTLPSAKRQPPQTEAERPVAKPVEPTRPGQKLKPDRAPVATAPQATAPASQPARATSPDSDARAPARPVAPSAVVVASRPRPDSDEQLVPLYRPAAQDKPAQPAPAFAPQPVKVTTASRLPLVPGSTPDGGVNFWPAPSQPVLATAVAPQPPARVRPFAQAEPTPTAPVQVASAFRPARAGTPAEEPAQTLPTSQARQEFVLVGPQAAPAQEAPVRIQALSAPAPAPGGEWPTSPPAPPFEPGLRLQLSKLVTPVKRLVNNPAKKVSPPLPAAAFLTPRLFAVQAQPAPSPLQLVETQSKAGPDLANLVDLPSRSAPAPLQANLSRDAIPTVPAPAPAAVSAQPQPGPTPTPVPVAPQSEPMVVTQPAGPQPMALPPVALPAQPLPQPQASSAAPVEGEQQPEGESLEYAPMAARPRQVMVEPAAVEPPAVQAPTPTTTAKPSRLPVVFEPALPVKTGPRPALKEDKPEPTPELELVPTNQSRSEAPEAPRQSVPIASVGRFLAREIPQHKHGHFEIELDPDRLGRLRIELTSSDDGKKIEGVLHVSADHARDALESQMPELRKALASQGIELRTQVVADPYGHGVAADSKGEGRQQRQQSQPASAGFDLATDDTPVANDPARRGLYA
ncbi:MAG: flagellar hook-length control protein FliK [Candidatus Eremiobacteraeota bacterium]|nr:flagellar hook-length control protein FliK [Candidatus Eremiobacteraeota bacterium]